MEFDKPIRRLALPFEDNSYDGNGRCEYIRSEHFACGARRYTQAASVLERDLLKLFDYISPSKANFETHSVQVHGLLLRFAVEVEANLKAILKENEYHSKNGGCNMKDYCRIEESHSLSKFGVKIMDFDGADVFYPFKTWGNREPLKWYQDYNAAKHDRHASFKQANFGSLIEAACGLFALLAAQFWTHDFSERGSVLGLGDGLCDGYESVAASIFRVRFPDKGEHKHHYSFTKSQLEAGRSDPRFFRTFRYSTS